MFVNIITIFAKLKHKHQNGLDICILIRIYATNIECFVELKRALYGSIRQFLAPCSLGNDLFLYTLPTLKAC